MYGQRLASATGARVSECVTQHMDEGLVEPLRIGSGHGGHTLTTGMTSLKNHMPFSRSTAVGFAIHMAALSQPLQIQCIDIAAYKPRGLAPGGAILTLVEIANKHIIGLDKA